MLQIEGNHFEEVIQILASYFERADEKIPFARMFKLRSAFSESNLPFFVDIVDWHRISEEFKEAILQDALKIY